MRFLVPLLLLAGCGVTYHDATTYPAKVASTSDARPHYQRASASSHRGSATDPSNCGTPDQWKACARRPTVMVFIEADDTSTGQVRSEKVEPSPRHGLRENAL
jgi:hypothetical protein